jgi:hypothetical protein
LDLQFFQELDCSIHCFWVCVAAFASAFFDAAGFVGVVF